MKSRFILTITLFWCSAANFAQYPNGDPHWVLTFFESFDSLNPVLYNHSNGPFLSGPSTIVQYNPSNSSVDGGQLLLSANRIGDTIYVSGLNTIGKKEFRYGYFEIEAQFPNVANSLGYHCAFWLHKGSCHNYAEIDIWEPAGWDGPDNHRYHCGLLGTSGSPDYIAPCNQCLPIDPLDPSCICEDIYCKGKTVFQPAFNGSLTSWNIYAAEWTPQSCIYYCNNQAMDFSMYPDLSIGPFVPHFQGNAQIVPSRPQELYLTFVVDWWVVDSNTTFPAILKFDNFKFYTLKTDCSHPLVATHYNFLNRPAVKSYIQLTNSVVPNDYKAFLRAVDYVQLNPDFEVPLGSELTVITHYGVCPE